MRNTHSTTVFLIKSFAPNLCQHFHPLFLTHGGLNFILPTSHPNIHLFAQKCEHMFVVKKDEAFHQHSYFVYFLRSQDCPAFTLFIYILTSLNAPLLTPLIARPNDLIKFLHHSHHHNRQRPKKWFAHVPTPVSPCYKLRMVILVSINDIVLIRIWTNS